MPYSSSFLQSSWWSTASKALFGSINTPSAYFLFSSDCVISSSNSTSTGEVDITFYGSLGRHVSHRACTIVRHSALSAALCAASAHDVHPNASRSFSAIRCHVYFGLPIDPFPTGVQFITIRQ